MVSGFCVISAKQFGPASFHKTWMFENFTSSKLCFPESKACRKFPFVRRWPYILSLLWKGCRNTNVEWPRRLFVTIFLPGFILLSCHESKKKHADSCFPHDTFNGLTPHFIPIKYALTDMFFTVFPENPSIKVVLVKKPDWVKSQKSSPNPI